MPVKVTTAPMSVRPRVSSAASAAASNGSRCRRTVADIDAYSGLHLLPLRQAWRLTARHRREEGDLARAGDRRVGGAHGLRSMAARITLRILERMGIFLAAPGEPVIRSATVAIAGRQLELLLGLADRARAPRRNSEPSTLTPRSGGARRRGNSPSRCTASAGRQPEQGEPDAGVTTGSDRVAGLAGDQEPDGDRAAAWSSTWRAASPAR